jgi:NAD+-dependent secondary alcohol dehydrogenase Adh1
VFTGIFPDGGFAQKVKTGARTVVKLDPSLHPASVAALADAGPDRVSTVGGIVAPPALML